MFFILSKILVYFTQPFLWVLTLLVVGWVYRKRTFSKTLFKLSLVLVFFFSNSVIFQEFLRKWEVSGVKTEEIPTYDCGILLTGMAYYNNDLERLSLNENGDRIWQTVNLYKLGKIKKILITGDSGQIVDRGLHEARQLAEVIEKWGIPKKDIIVEIHSQNTNENAAFTAKLLKNFYPEIKSKLLITSAFHMKRALACFEKRGLKCKPFSVSNRTASKRKYYWEQFILPNSKVIYDWEQLTKEWTGYFMYWMAGYI